MGCGANFIVRSGSSIAAHTLHYSRDRTGVNKSRVSMENNLIRQSGRASLAQFMIGASAYCIKKYGGRRQKNIFVRIFRDKKRAPPFFSPDPGASVFF